MPEHEVIKVRTDKVQSEQPIVKVTHAERSKQQAGAEVARRLAERAMSEWPLKTEKSEPKLAAKAKIEQSHTTPPKLQNRVKPNTPVEHGVAAKSERLMQTTVPAATHSSRIEISIAKTESVAPVQAVRQEDKIVRNNNYIEKSLTSRKMTLDDEAGAIVERSSKNSAAEAVILSNVLLKTPDNFLQATDVVGDSGLDTVEDVSVWSETELADITAEVFAQTSLLRPFDTGLYLSEVSEIDASDKANIAVVRQEIMKNFQELELAEQAEAVAITETVIAKLQEVFELQEIEAPKLADGTDLVAVEVELIALVINLLQTVHVEPSEATAKLVIMQLIEEIQTKEQEKVAFINEAEGTHEHKIGLQYLLQQLAKLTKQPELPHMHLGRAACRILLPVALAA